jgi:hypothetical protein
MAASKNIPQAPELSYEEAVKVAEFGFDVPAPATPRPVTPVHDEAVQAINRAAAKVAAAQQAPIRRTPAEWCERKGIVITVANGWDIDTPNFDHDWNSKINEAEFDRRAAKSATVPAGTLGRQDNVRGRVY